MFLQLQNHTLKKIHQVQRFIIYKHPQLQINDFMTDFISTFNFFFNKSILKSPNKKIVLEDSFCSFNYNREIKSVIKSYILSLGCLYMINVWT